jgi:hypothetical protein
MSELPNFVSSVKLVCEPKLRAFQRSAVGKPVSRLLPPALDPGDLRLCDARLFGERPLRKPRLRPRLAK